MNVLVKPRATVVERDLPFECIALVLQGGGALGAYQAGVYEALAEAGIYSDWVAGISIGAINCAIIAGNPPEPRIEKLRGFWECITTNPWRSSFEWTIGRTGDAARAWLNAYAEQSLAYAAKGQGRSNSEREAYALFTKAPLAKSLRSALERGHSTSWTCAEKSPTLG